MSSNTASLTENSASASRTTKRLARRRWNPRGDDVPQVAKRAILNGPRELEFQDVLLPPDITEDQLLARTEFSAVSLGTEMAAYSGEPPLRPGIIYPRLVGYCN